MSPVLRTTISILLLLLAGLSVASAQGRLSIYDLDAGGFPLIRAGILPEDDTGNPLTGLRPEDVSVTENGLPRRVTRLACSSTEIPRALSIAVSFDVSTSMYALPTASGAMAFPLGQDAIRFLARELPLPHSEMALQGFDTDPRGGIDFTRQRRPILDEVDRLPLGGDNGFEAQMLRPGTGLLNIAKRGAHRRVAILVSDDNICAGPIPASIIQPYIDTCARYSIRFYALIYRISSTDEFSLQPLVDATGGRLYDMIAEPSEAEAAIEEILAIEQGGGGCEIEWESAPGCPELRDVTISIPRFGLTTRTGYRIPATAVPGLTVAPSGLGFGAIGPGRSRSMTFTVTASNFPATIRSIDGIAAPFTLEGIDFPFTLQPGERRTITVTFTPSDSTFSFATLRVNRDDCPPVPLFLTGGVAKKIEPLRIIYPNGGEKLLAGSTTTLRWTGVPAGDSVSLEYSIDRGARWQTIVTGTTGVEYRWPVPFTPSNECLLRISNAGGGSSVIRFAAPRGDTLRWTAFAPDGNLIAVANDDFSASLRNAATGLETRRLTGHIRAILSIEFSPDGKHVVTASEDNAAIVWEVATGRLVHLMRGHFGPVMSAVFSPDGSRILTAGDERTIIWSTETGGMLGAIAEQSRVADARFGPDGSQLIISARDVIVREAFTGELLHREPTMNARHAEFSSTGSLALVLDLNRISVHETNTWREIATMSNPTGRIITMAHLRAGDNMVVSTTTNGIEFRHPFSGALLAELPGHGAKTTSAAFTSDGRRLATVGDGGGAIWNLSGSALGADLSDSLWSIVLVEDLAANFSLSDESICQGECVDVSDASSADVTTWDWTFEGGSPLSATGRTPVRVCYAQPGRYAVRLIVGNGSERDTITRWLNVSVPPPMPVISQCGAVLSTTPGAASYTWFRNDIEIDGAAAGQLRIDSPGTYRVTTTNAEGCVATSEPVVVTTTDAAELAISIPEIEGAPGEIVEVPVSFRFSNPGIGNRYRIGIILQFNASMLLPIDGVDLGRAADQRRVEIGLDDDAFRDTTVIVRMRVALGESSESRLSVVSVSHETTCLDRVNLEDGRFLARGLCNNGGLRLVATANASALKSIHPNPAPTVVTVEYSLVENGPISIELFDPGGSHVATIASGIQSPGEYATTFNLSTLPSGDYFCRYTTPTEVFTKRLRVE